METNPEMNNEVIISSVPKTKKVKKQTNLIVEDDVKSFIKQYSIQKRRRILYKIIYWKQIENAIKKCKIKKGANMYAFEYLKLNLNKYVRIKDVQEYCNKRTKEETGHPLGDPPRAFEILRKDKLPLEWSEIKYKKNKYVKYTPQIKDTICNKIIDTHKHKNDGFNKHIIEEKLKLSNYKCSITGIPQDNGELAADHFIPKEKGGLSDKTNCVIINKILNEKKNKKMPIEWFCETILTNFMNICKNVGIIQECKEKIIKFVQEF
uniref:HNH nuclease domain-containing protein n=1 Tax=viral metagenome TaxID=1070528 RepID=A0A6C0EVH8_9ZZZZ